MTNKRNNAKKMPGRKGKSLLAGHELSNGYEGITGSPSVPIFASSLFLYLNYIIYGTDAFKAHAVLQSCSG